MDHVIKHGRLELAEAAKRATQKLLYSTTQREHRSFLVLCIIYHRFIAGFFKLAAPFNKRLRNNKPNTLRTLKEAGLQSVDALQNVETNTQILVLPRTNEQFTIDTDACDTHLGCVLLKTQEEGTRSTTRHYSLTVSDSECKLVKTRK